MKTMKTLLVALTLLVSVAAHGSLDLDQFHSYYDVMNYLDHLVGNCADGLTSTVNTAGHSNQARDLKTLTLSTAPSANKPIYFTDRITHAREWITVTTLLKVIEHMCYNYGTDVTVTRLLDTYDFVFLPIQDPDGYPLTQSHEQMVRKNPGVDIQASSSCTVEDPNTSYNWNEAQEVCGIDCIWDADCSSDEYCNVGTCCKPDASCNIHCIDYGDCSQDTYCNGTYYMCCHPPPEEVCNGHCYGYSDCTQDVYCSGTYYMCCAPPPDLTCNLHCYYLDDCDSDRYCHPDILMCCDPPPDMTCRSHCAYMSDCDSAQYCYWDIKMCCDPPAELECRGHCYTDADCTTGSGCNFDYDMCCALPADAISELADDNAKEDAMYGLTDAKEASWEPLCLEFRGKAFVKDDPSETQPSFDEIWAGIVAAIQENEIIQ